ncbi:MAG: flagellar hook-basal body complex protein, partial [Succinivibrionaceae bacterium]|nr:flagellar hook-basal body complex protein [Succinivibrionaceae bacterium]
MFGISLSGLNCSQKYLDVTSNNIANANSIGFKRSRAEFADIYSMGVFSNHKTAVGLGATCATVAQQFVQGSLSGDTGNNLDMAIQGGGFFVLSPEANESAATSAQSRTYTRAGAFETNKDGFVVTPQGDYLQVWDVNEENRAASLDITSTHALKIPSDTGAPRQSTELGIKLNLPANATAKTVTGFDPSNSATYNCSTSQTLNDSLGGTHTLTYYFVKNGSLTEADGKTSNNTTLWTAFTYVDGKPVDIADLKTDDPSTPAAPVTVLDADGKPDTCPSGDKDNPVIVTIDDANSSINGTTLHGFQMIFDASGTRTTLYPQALYLANLKNTYPVDTDRGEYSLNYVLGTGQTDQQVHLTMTSTQYGSSAFTVNESPTNDGYSTGLLINCSVDSDGVVQAEYSNGRNV